MGNWIVQWGQREASGKPQEITDRSSILNKWQINSADRRRRATGEEKYKVMETS